MAAGLSAKLHKSSQITTFIKKLTSPEMKLAAVRGLNEHTGEQRRLSITTIASFTGVPRGRIARVTKIVKAKPGGMMMAKVITRDQAIGLEEHGNPRWTRDLNPMADGKRGGSVSSMAGVEATAWNRTRTHKGTFFAQGVVYVRRPDGSLRKIYSTVLANELANPGWRNATRAQKFMAFDLEKRTVRHMLRVLG